MFVDKDNFCLMKGGRNEKWRWSHESAGVFDMYRRCSEPCRCVVRSEGRNGRNGNIISDGERRIASERCE